MEITQYIGIGGAVTYLLSYILLQLGKVDGNGNVYAFLNMLAAAFVMISLTTHFNIGSLIIQISFISLSIYAILRSFLGRRAIKLSPIETELVSLMFPNLPPRRALPLIRKGTWKNTVDDVLATEGKPLDTISIIIFGEAEVSKAGQTVARIGGGQMVGEVTWENDAPATADVVIKGPAHYFTISRKTMRAFLKKNTDVAASFELGLRNQLKRKLA